MIFIHAYPCKLSSQMLARLSSKNITRVRHPVVLQCCVATDRSRRAQKKWKIISSSSIFCASAALNESLTRNQNELQPFSFLASFPGGLCCRAPYKLYWCQMKGFLGGPLPTHLLREALLSTYLDRRSAVNLFGSSGHVRTEDKWHHFEVRATVSVWAYGRQTLPILLSPTTYMGCLVGRILFGVSQIMANWHMSWICKYFPTGT